MTGELSYEQSKRPFPVTKPVLPPLGPLPVQSLPANVVKPRCAALAAPAPNVTIAANASVFSIFIVYLPNKIYNAQELAFS